MEFEPGVFLDGDHNAVNSPSANLVILNQPISSFAIFKRIWGHARYRICADGGANRLYDMFSGTSEQQRKEYVSE